MKYKTDNIGKNIKEIIDFLGLTQSEFSERAGITQAAVSQIINNERKPSIETLVAILEVFPTTFERLCK